MIDVLLRRLDAWMADETRDTKDTGDLRAKGVYVFGPAVVWG